MKTTKVHSEMPGSVFVVEKNVGDPVHADETLLIVESMKMEIPVVSPASGRVVRIAVVVGDQVAEGQLLVEIEH